VAALQPDDVEAAAAVGDEQARDLGLVEPLAVDDERPGRALGDQLGGDQAVVDEHVAAADQLEPPRRDQAGIAGPGADQEHGHRSDSSTTASKKSRRSRYVR